MVLTRMAFDANSLARTREKAVNAAFDAAYKDVPATPTSDDTEEIKTMEAPFFILFFCNKIFNTTICTGVIFKFKTQVKRTVLAQRYNISSIGRLTTIEWQHGDRSVFDFPPF